MQKLHPEWAPLLQLASSEDLSKVLPVLGEARSREHSDPAGQLLSAFLENLVQSTQTSGSDKLHRLFLARSSRSTSIGSDPDAGPYPGFAPLLARYVVDVHLACNPRCNLQQEQEQPDNNGELHQTNTVAPNGEDWAAKLQGLAATCGARLVVDGGQPRVMRVEVCGKVRRHLTHLRENA